MFFKSFIDENLAQNSYLVGCQETGESIIIDPARSLDQYFQTAINENLEIVAAAETHIHADFLSGARELGVQHNVMLYLSDEGEEEWKYDYLDEVKNIKLKGGMSFSIGNIIFDVLHTPGHTPESISFLLRDSNNKSNVYMGIFTGDFVFVGDIGRPDLLEKSANISGTAKVGAKNMFSSIKKIKEFPDFLQIWPGHGAGSACGKSLGAVPMSTLGYEKSSNWAFKEQRENDFINQLTTNQPEPPKYFGTMKQLNKKGAPLLNKKKVQQIKSLEYIQQKAMDSSYLILDTRKHPDFSKKFLKGAINILFNQSFANWAGWLIDYNKEIILLAEEAQVIEIKRALESIGLDNINSYMDVQLLYNEYSMESYAQIEPKELENLLNSDDIYLIDVRHQNEWEEGHIEGAHHHMLGTLEEAFSEIPSNKLIGVQCRTGQRSAIGTSLLKAHGFERVVNVEGGIQYWMQQNFPIL